MQQINLLTNLSLKKEFFLSAPVMLLFSILWIVVLSVVGSAIWVTNLKSEIAFSLKQLQLEQRVLDTQAKLPKVYRQKKETSEVDLTKVITLNQGFSRYFDMLSKYTPDQVWLNNMSFISSGHVVTLQGGVLSKDIMDDFVQALDSNNLLRVGNFNTVHIAKIPKTNRFSFTIRAGGR